MSSKQPPQETAPVTSDDAAQDPNTSSSSSKSSKFPVYGIVLLVIAACIVIGLVIFAVYYKYTMETNTNKPLLSRASESQMNQFLRNFNKRQFQPGRQNSNGFTTMNFKRGY